MSELPAIENYIAGEFVVPDGEACAPITDSNTGLAVQDMCTSSSAQLQRALDCAQHLYASGDWSGLPVLERADLLDAMADATENAAFVEQVAFADALTSGVRIRETRLTAKLVAANLKSAASLIRGGLLDRSLEGVHGEVDWKLRPWGVAALIGPYNGPTVIGSHKIASALAAGAPAIYKPSEFTPHSAVLMARAAASAGLPPGALQVIQGGRNLGRELVVDRRVASVSFTGGVPAGRSIAEATASNLKPLQLELGGNNPLIVFEDADIDLVVKGVVFGLTTLNGQWCRGLGRIVVHRRRSEELLARLTQALSELTLGSSMDEHTDVGPLVDRRAVDNIRGRIQACERLGGALVPPPPPSQLNGFFIAPGLIVGCKPEDTQEEIFGPVAYFHEFSTDEEALNIANGTPFGLAAYVYSRDVDRARRFALNISAGGVKINGYSLLSLHPHAPRANWGMSGLNDEGAIQTIEFFCGSRVVGLSAQD